MSLIDFIEIETGGTAVKFGELSVGRHYVSGISNSTRALFAGGSNPYTNAMEYITIASTGNAADFGDIFTGRYSVSSCSNSNRAVFLGGRTTSPSVVYYNAMEFVTISTTGNTSDFGDITGAATGSQGGAAGRAVAGSKYEVKPNNGDIKVIY